MTRFLQSMMENQQRQTEILHQGLLTAPHEQRPGSISDFKRLQPAIFLGTEKPIDAEQWLINTIDLLKAARIPEENQDTAEGCGQNLMVGRRSKIGEAHLLGSVFEEFL